MSENNTIGITQIGQIAINVHDLDKAIAFYRDVLGLQFLFHVPGLAFFQCGEVRLMLSNPGKPEFDHPASTLYYKVPDINAAYAKLKAQAVRLIDEPHLIAKMPDHDLWMFFCYDPDGNTVGLMSEVRPGQ